MARTKTLWPADAPPQLFVFTGAGLSADSGIPTFRDADGTWENESIDRVCNQLTWKRHAEAVHAFYNARRAQLATVAPNPAHELLARWQSRWGERVRHFTQNVDDVAERAGYAGTIHLHGRLTEMLCEACGHVWEIGYAAWSLDGRCPRCASRKGVRPNVVFFHQRAPLYAVLRKAIAALRPQDVAVIIGTSGAVIPITRMLRGKGAFRILNNLAPSPHIDHARDVDAALFMPAAQAAERLDALVIPALASERPRWEDQA